MPNTMRLLPAERRVTTVLAFLFILRMLGLFMVLPVIAWYAKSLPGATSSLIGVCIGIYGFSQALLQLPLGRLSDRIGRKPVILLGLMLLVFGSIIAALSHTLWGIIVGRALQGAGAIGATILALIADSTRDVVRTRAMAIIGISIGSSFVLAFILGPLIDSVFGLSGIFWVTAILSIFAMGVSYFTLPNQQVTKALGDKLSAWSLLVKYDLWRLHFGIFVLHASLTMSFLFIPLLISQVLGWDKVALWKFYLPVLGSAFLMVVPLSRWVDKKKVGKSFLCGAMIVFALAEALLEWSQFNKWIFIVVMVIFFSAFTLLEAMFPAWVSRIAPAQYKGAVMGVFSTAQFSGIFVGGFLGGILQQIWGSLSLVVLSVGLMLLWVVFVRTLQVSYDGNILSVPQ